MSTTGPVIWTTRPVAGASLAAFLAAFFVAEAVAMIGVVLLVSSRRQRARAPLAISIISRVMFAWRTLLYDRVRSSISSSAFSVAFFIATIRLDSLSLIHIDAADELT